MRPRVARRWAGEVAALALACLAASSGCGKRGLLGASPANQAPVLKISDSDIQPSQPGQIPRAAYTASFEWTSFDPDGVVDHYVYTLSPADTDVARSSAWRSTRKHSVTLRFASADSALPVSPADSSSRFFEFEGFHGFFVRAVDNAGGMSAWDSRFFNSVTVAPTTTLSFPVGSKPTSDITGLTFVPRVPVGPSVLARWSGVDPDAFDARKLPVRYHVFFLDVSPSPEKPTPYEGDIMIRRTLATRGFYVGGDTTQYPFRLVVGHTYCLVVRAVDEAGAEEPLPSLKVPVPPPSSPRNTNTSFLGKNVAIFVSLPGQASPPLTVTAGIKTRNFKGYDPEAALLIEAPVRSDISFSWAAGTSPSGAAIASYRYALDIDDPTSDHPKVNRPGGFTWSLADSRSTFAVVTGYPSRGDHTFYIQATDDAGASTIAVIKVSVIEATFDRPLLYLLDDPNLISGQGTTPSMTIQEVINFWRDILETDRFYVRRSASTGDKRCTSMAGATDFYRPKDYSGSYGIPLSLLSRYRAVVWFSPRYASNPGFRSALHDMVTGYSSTANTLFTYLQFGGHVWIYGGGVVAQMSASTGLTYPLFGQAPGKSGQFVVDALGIAGADTLSNTFLADRGFPAHNTAEYAPELRAIEPAPVNFMRPTALGLVPSRIPNMDFDYTRYDTMTAARRGSNFDPEQLLPITNEYMRGTPDAGLVARDSAGWQPIALYRSKGPNAESTRISGQRLAIDRAVTGWYVRGTSLYGPQGSKVRAPFQLYYFGVPLHLFNREQVRELADVLLSTDGWDIWRGGCPAEKAGGAGGKNAAPSR